MAVFTDSDRFGSVTVSARVAVTVTPWVPTGRPVYTGIPQIFRNRIPDGITTKSDSQKAI